MKTSYFLPITITLLFAFVIVHITAIFYIADKTEMEDNKNPAFHSTIQMSESHFANFNPAASQAIAIK